MQSVWTRGRLVFFGISSVGIWLVVWAAGPVLLPFLVALILAYVLTPLVQWLQRHGVARGPAVGLVGLAVIGLLVLTGALGLPRLYEELKHVREGLPQVAQEIDDTWGPWVEARSVEFFGREAKGGVVVEEAQVVIQPLPAGGYGIVLNQPIDLVQKNAKEWELRPRTAPEPFEFGRFVRGLIDSSFDYLRQNTREVLRIGGALLGSASRTILLFFMTLMCTGYLMYTHESVGRFWRTLPPEEARASFARWLRRADRGLSGVVRGQVIICGVNGVLSGIGFALLGVKYWPLLAVLAAVFSLIPIFGAILSSIPAVLVALTQSPWTALWVLLWILGIHQVEANVLNPKIMGDSAKLHPVLVIFALVVGEHSYGLPGALFALPVLSLAQTTFLHFRAELFPEHDVTSTPPPLSAPSGLPASSPPHG